MYSFIDLGGEEYETEWESYDLREGVGVDVGDWVEIVHSGKSSAYASLVEKSKSNVIIMMRTLPRGGEVRPRATFVSRICGVVLSGRCYVSPYQDVHLAIEFVLMCDGGEMNVVSVYSKTLNLARESILCKVRHA